MCTNTPLCSSTFLIYKWAVIYNLINALISIYWLLVASWSCPAGFSFIRFILCLFLYFFSMVVYVLVLLTVLGCSSLVQFC